MLKKRIIIQNDSQTMGAAKGFSENEI